MPKISFQFQRYLTSHIKSSNQQGFISQALLLLLVAGIGLGAYLVGQKTNLLPKASGETIQIVDSAGNPITTTPTPEVNVKLTAPWAPIATVSVGRTVGRLQPQTASGSARPNPSCSPRPRCLDNPPFCLMAEPPGGWCPSPKPTPPVECSNGADCKEGQYCQRKICALPEVCSRGAPAYNQKECEKWQKEHPACVGICIPKPTPPPFGIRITMAEDPNFTLNVKTVPYYKAPLFTKYVFSGNPGKKTLYAKFERQTSPSGPVAKVNANPYPAIIELIKSSSPGPSPSGVFCPQDIIECPDGSQVGRGGPNCEFDKCPSELKSGIYGEAIMSPTCPGPAREGQECTKPFQGVLYVYNKDKSSLVAKISTDTNGEFRVSLSPGEYIIASYPSRYPRLADTKVIVEANKFTKVTLSLDTGIR